MRVDRHTNNKQTDKQTSMLITTVRSATGDVVISGRDIMSRACSCLGLEPLAAVD